MKVVVTAHDRLSVRDDQPEGIRQLLAAAPSDLKADQAPLFKAFVNGLAAATPVRLLGTLGNEQLSSLLLGIFRLVQQRSETVAIGCFPLGARRSLLVTNCPDAPNLLQTLQLVLNRMHVHARIVAHPLFRIERSARGLKTLGGLDSPSGIPEAVIAIDIEGLDTGTVKQLNSQIVKAMEAVLAFAASRQAIRDRLQQLAVLPSLAPFQPLLEWLAAGNGDFFAARVLKIDLEGDKAVELTAEHLGLPDLFATELPEPRPLADCPDTLRTFLLRTEPVGIELLDRFSPLLRDERMIYLGVRDVQPDGSWLEFSFIGLFSERGRLEPALQVPELRMRVEQALRELHIPAESYNYDKVLSIFNSFPKPELFLMSPAAVLDAVRSFTLLYRHGRVRIIPVPQVAIRGLTLLLIMPRAYYTDAVLARMENYLARFCRGGGLSTRMVHVADDYLSLHVNLRPTTDEIHLDLERLEHGLTQLAEPWSERLHRLLDRARGEHEGDRLLRSYAEAFPPEYRQLTHPRFAVRDIARLEALRRSGEEQLALWGPFRSKGGHCRLQFYSLDESYLNALMPLLENLNLTVLDETDFVVSCRQQRLYLKSFSVRSAGADAPPLHTLREPLLDALAALRAQRLENDYLNRLLVLTGLTWRQIDIFRGYRNYLFQLGTPFTKRRVAYALINNPQIARLLYQYFEARFAPSSEWHNVTDREELGLMPIRLQLAAALEEVADINEDAILRSFFNLIDSTVRTNFFRRSMLDEPYFAFKISALGIIDMPAPRPLYEIYVHSARMEGIHLRGGKVARGGIRWSDRPDDFRTEILGLMKTQMTKNALIVPVGSKGGFVTKTPAANREEALALAKEAYKTLMRGLLDLTDNRVGGEIVPPPDTICYDEPDPYLVVAADKGTAHLPDTANGVAADYGFWLGDAFASGGSQGYDHKALGITARGAWESVKRHFREMGLDVQSQPFTVVGIGDMSGDVFGNGMLLSKQIRLLAAFDHRHIFIDPDPDPATSFAERQRLAQLPRSSWDDYDRNLISQGGGVWPRSAKEIPLSEAVQGWLGIRHASLDGQSLIRRLLAADVDLLWNGGIGTYVKSSSQTHDAVGDRANDGVRIDATELRARVVGEGGNLGMTQLGRIEFAHAGGRLYTDAIDNSAGVDCSDHEVNLKILMQHLTEAGVIASREERDRFLKQITDDVCVAVLRHNVSQTRCVSLDEIRCRDNAEPFLALIDRLGRAGLLDRRGENLPSRRDVMSRDDGRLYTPELSVLLAYSKMHLYQALLESELPESPAARHFLQSYFPPAVLSQYGKFLNEHPLAREIAATVMTNGVIDQAGSASIIGVAERTGAAPALIAGAYLQFDAALSASQLRTALDASGVTLPMAERYALLLRLEAALIDLAEAAVQDETLADVVAIESTGPLQGELQSYLRTLPAVLSTSDWGDCQMELDTLVESGVDEDSAKIFVLLPWLDDFWAVSRLTRSTRLSLHAIAGLFRDVRNRLEFPLLLQRLDDVPMRDAWDRSAKRGVRDRFLQGLVRMVDEICQNSDGNPDAYFARHRIRLQGWQNLQAELRQASPANLHAFTVFADHLNGFFDT